jgi:uncharacterized protein YcbX
MAPEILKTTDVSWFGLAGDRRWAFVRDEAVKSDFPWLTIREKNNMNHYVPQFIDNAKPDKSSTIVKTPTGNKYDIIDSELAKELYPKGTRVIKQARGIFDTFPLSLITTQTVDSMSKSTDSELTPERFRANFLVRAIGNEAYPEDNWVGKIIRIGTMRMRIDKRDGRCVVITIDPITSEKTPEVLKYVYKNREGCLGVYGSTVRPGIVSVKDNVYLEN